MEAYSLLSYLEQMPAGIARDFFLFQWKWKYCPDAGLFSTAHGGDCAGNLLKALAGELVWEDTAIIDGKKVVLEYERNFNNFVQKLK